MGEHHFFEKECGVFFLVVVFGKICWILSPANLTKTLMEKIPFWGIEERFGESGWSREIWSNLERWKMKHGHDWKFTLINICITDHRSFVIMRHYFKALSTSNQSRLQFNHLNLGCFEGICRLPVKQRETMYFFSNTFNPQDPKNDDSSQEIRFQKTIS